MAYHSRGGGNYLQDFAKVGALNGLITFYEDFCLKSAK